MLFFFAFLLNTGLGKTAPDPSATISLEGVDVPLGKGIPSGISDTCLLYNEYPLKCIFLRGVYIDLFHDHHGRAAYLIEGAASTQLKIISKGSWPQASVTGVGGVFVVWKAWRE